jgi:hypothetical protein
MAIFICFRQKWNGDDTPPMPGGNKFPQEFYVSAETDSRNNFPPRPGGQVQHCPC